MFLRGFREKKALNLTKKPPARLNGIQTDFALWCFIKLYRSDRYSLR